MADQETTSLDDQFAALLEKGEAAIHSGTPWCPEEEPGVPPILVPRLQKAHECLALLGAMWPRSAAGAGTLTDDGNQERQSTNFDYGGGVRQIGGYQILGELGRGGMGVVYQAWQSDLKRPVALKMILAGMHAAPQHRTRFRREAQMAAGLRHPHIVQVYEIGEHDGCPFFSLEFMDGGSLSWHVTGRPQPPREAAEIVEGLARAVHYAHEAGVIHRDLKPSNILLQRRKAAKRSGEGQESSVDAPATGRLCADYYLKVGDFGLARELDDDTTRTGQLVGTPSYMAPEQAEGKTQLVGRAVDVYGLGAILYELLTGRPPFKGKTPQETLDHVKNREPLPPRQQRPNVPRDLERICLKCLDKNPRRRYDSALDLTEDLNRFLSGEPVLARPAGRLERSWRWCKRNRTVASLAAMIFISLLGGTVAALYFAAEADTARQLSDRRRYDAQIHLANQAWKNVQVSLTKSLLRKQEARFQGFEWRFLNRLSHLDLRTLEGHADEVTCLAYDSDGKRLVTGSADRTVRIWEVATGRQIVILAETADPVRCVAFSPNGQWIAAGTAGFGDDSSALLGEVKVWDAVSGKEQFSAQLPGHVWALAFSPDSSQLVIGGSQTKGESASAGPIRILGLPAGNVVQELEGHPVLKGQSATVHGLAFSPDGNYIASASQDMTLRIWHGKTGKLFRTLERQKSPMLAVAFSPDGKHVASADWYGVAKVWNVGTGQVTAQFTGHRAAVTSIAFCFDGRRIASASRDGTVKVWHQADPRDFFTLEGHEGIVHGVACSPDGWRLASASADRTVKIWDARASHDVTCLDGHCNIVNGLAFSPDGQRLASASSDRTLRIWDLNLEKEIHVLRGHREAISSLTFHPDGMRLASAGMDGNVIIWDTSIGKQIQTIRGHTNAVLGTAFSPDGRWLASAGEDQTIRLWNMENNVAGPILTGHASPVQRVVFSVDGKRLVTAAASNRNRKTTALSELKVWNTVTWQKENDVWQGPEVIRGLSLAADGRIAWGCNDGTIKIWDNSHDKEPISIHGHSIGVLDVAFSPDGKRLASAGADSTVKLWDCVTLEELLTLTGNAGPVACLAFRGDGCQLASAGSDGSGGCDYAIRIWDSGEVSDAMFVRREALALVQFLHAQPACSNSMIDRIQGDATIADSVRKQAVEFAGFFRSNADHWQAEKLLQSIVRKLQLKEDVLAEVGRMRELPNGVRQELSKAADAYVENPATLNYLSRSVVVKRDRKDAAYKQALREAQAAHDLAPGKGAHVTTLGMALYRIRAYQQAIETLGKADQLNTAAEGTSIPADLAFLAMALHHLHRDDAAKATMARLQEVMKSPHWARQEEANAFAREAQEVLLTQPVKDP